MKKFYSLIIVFAFSGGVAMAQNLNININVDGESMETNVSGSDSSMSVDVNVSGSSSSSTTTTTTTTTSSSDDTDDAGTVNVNVDDTDQSTTTAVTQCFTSPTEMQEILTAIDAEDFDDVKMNVMNQAIRNRCFTVSQIRQMMDKFDFEEDKLSVAKKAYDSCIDTDNYYQLSQAFEFSDSKQDLNQFISSKN